MKPVCANSPGTGSDRLHIGIDLDNTIINYEHVFGRVAEITGLVPPGSGLAGKEAVKTHLIAADSTGALWMQLQGQVYGRFIGLAEPYPGVVEFLTAMQRSGAKVSIVSHKTEYGHFDEARVHLWEAALGWLELNGFFASPDFGLDRADVHFATTRDAKVAQIRALGCRVFVDDLPEVMLHPNFPDKVDKIWFTGGRVFKDAMELNPHPDWLGIMDSARNWH